MSDDGNTFAPARNFTITVAEQVRAAYGPPAYAVRRRRIEDLEAKLVVLLAAAEEEVEIRKLLGTLNRLVDAHNAYYPCEANLPMDPKTGALLERGAPWRPLPRFDLDALRARARAT